MNPPAVITRKYEDQCGCRTGCSYPNNVWAILPAQISTSIAFISSILSIADCRLVRVPNFTMDDLYNGTIPDGVVNNNATFRSIGFFGWENINGKCSYESYEGSASGSDEQPFPYVKKYLGFVGQDFIPLLIMKMVVTMLGFLVLLWMMCLLSCVAHKRLYRYALVVTLIFILPLFQSLTFRILATEFCQEKKCELDEGSGLTIFAIILYFTAGLILCIGTHDFPGNPYKKQKQVTILTTLRSYFGKKSEAMSSNETNENNNNNQWNNGSPTAEAEMINFSNGFADAVEIPVDSEFIDRTLIEAGEGPPTPTHVTIDLMELMNSTNAYAVNDTNHVAITSRDNLHPECGV